MSDYVEIDIDEIVRESEDAILVAIDTEEIWIPKSQIDEYDDNQVSVKEWIAIEKGLV
ncbi:hypothetical protein LCGC14_2828880 [marine sediment metagenome]|uniref:Uncharacterized protein n=1 Tax=marine sediment metagenome TaxID=412755 RepID=A0A0F8YER7_9ZZZZ